MTLAFDKCPSCGKPFSTCPCSLSKANMARNYKDLKGNTGSFPAVPQGTILLMCPQCFSTVPEGFVKQHRLICNDRSL